MSTNNKPQLPDIFPTEDVTVDREKHTYLSSETSTGYADQYDYVLNKAPIDRIEKVEGINRSGQEIEFNNGSDYILENYVDTLSESFDYSLYDEYTLQSKPDDGSASITDTDGNSYDESADFQFVQAEDDINTIEWVRGADQPNSGETFTFKYQTRFVYDSSKRQYIVENIPQDGAASIKDSRGNIYQIDQQFNIFSNDDDTEVIKWDVTQSTPEDGEQFTYIYEESFTLNNDKESYKIRRLPEAGSVTVQAIDGTEFVQDTDYSIIQNNVRLDTIEWIGTTPDVGETFTVVYDFTYERSVLRWKADADNLPKRNSYFYVTYVSESVISRYLRTAGDELDLVEEQLNSIIEKKFVDKATGKDLDRLGTLFGDVIGKRSGRDDTQYRIYLKSVVQSFVSRGTINGIKVAVSAATGVPIENITIREDFNKTGYDVVVIPNNPVQKSVVSQIARIADPSGVELLRVRFSPPPDEMAVDDVVRIIQPEEPTDTMGATDSVTKVEPESIIDRASVDDTLDAYEVAALNQLWESNTVERETEWDLFSWTGIPNIGESIDEVTGTRDVLSIEIEKTVAPDTMGIADSVVIDSEPISDVMRIGDDVTITIDVVNSWGNDWNTIIWQ